MGAPLSGLSIFICNRIVGNIPSHAVRRWVYRHIYQFRIGRGSTILMNVRFSGKRQVELGDHSVINSGCVIDNRAGVVIGRNVSISLGTALITSDHDPQSPVFRTRFGAIVIEDYVFIGARALVLPGVHLGRRAWLRREL